MSIFILFGTYIIKCCHRFAIVKVETNKKQRSASLQLWYEGEYDQIFVEIALLMCMSLILEFRGKFLRIARDIARKISPIARGIARDSRKIHFNTV